MSESIAVDGVKALDLAVKNDMILLDYVVPDQSGIECLADFKSIFPSKKIPVILYACNSERKAVSKHERIKRAISFKNYKMCAFF